MLSCLVTQLAAVIDHQARESLLDAYEHGRRPVAQRVIAFTDRMTRIDALGNRQLCALRNLAMTLVGRIPFVRKRLVSELAELRYRSTENDSEY